MLWVKNKNKIKHINNKCCEFLQKHLTDDAEAVTEDALLSKIATQ
jgi:predicted thioesterase